MIKHSEVQQKQLRRLCQDIIQQVMGFENANYFFRPVDPKADGAPDYFKFVTKPMSIFKVQEQLDKGMYTDFEDFVKDMRQIWQNALIFNNVGHPIHRAAEKISRRFELLISSAPRTLSEGSKSNSLQRAVELRFAIYRDNRKSHQ